MNNNQEETEKDINDITGAIPPENPPIFKTWKGMYLFLIGFLAFQILIYYIITLAYS